MADILMEDTEEWSVKKKGSQTLLRHSFTTHLLEKRIDIRYIKDIWGHFDLKTVRRQNKLNFSLEIVF